MPAWIYRWFAIGVLTTLLPGGCALPPPRGEVVCYDDRSLCYRDHVIDRRATRDRYGVEGQHSINRDNF